MMTAKSNIHNFTLSLKWGGPWGKRRMMAGKQAVTMPRPWNKLIENLHQWTASSYQFVLFQKDVATNWRLQCLLKVPANSRKNWGNLILWMLQPSQAVWVWRVLSTPSSKVISSLSRNHILVDLHPVQGYSPHPRIQGEKTW